MLNVVIEGEISLKSEKSERVAHVAQFEIQCSFRRGTLKLHNFICGLIRKSFRKDGPDISENFKDLAEVIKKKKIDRYGVYRFGKFVTFEKSQEFEK